LNRAAGFLGDAQTLFDQPEFSSLPARIFIAARIDSSQILCEPFRWAKRITHRERWKSYRIFIIQQY
jgi:hypothetical protein